VRIGFIGLGTMGSRMAPHLLAAGGELVVHDIDRAAADALVAAGGQWVESPMAVARACDVVITSLPTPSVVEQVMLGDAGILAGARPGTVVFDTSTNAHDVVLRVAEAFAAADCHFLDAPVSGGPSGAASGNLAIWVGGDEAVFEDHRDVLDAFTDRPRYIGPVGQATVAKLVHNCSGYMIQTALAEAFTMGVRAGVDPLTLWSALRQGAQGRVRTFDRMARQFLPAQYDPPAFALRLAHKDMTLATQLGREVGVPMRLAGLAHAEMSEALQRGWGEQDSRVSMRLQVERAGVDIAVDPVDLQAILDEDR
jgi:3-hydroxyisobutyrate dehydrogenase-like beta-hydroxyacid dehydrogenase